MIRGTALKPIQQNPPPAQVVAEAFNMIRPCVEIELKNPPATGGFFNSHRIYTGLYPLQANL